MKDRAAQDRRGAAGRSKKDLACTPLIRNAQKEWFGALHRKAAAGQPYIYADAYCPHEIFEAFGLETVVNEWWSGIVAARRQSAYYFDRMEEAGFHSGLERYTALGLATVLDGDKPDPPWGGLPTPAMVAFSVLSARSDGLARPEMLANAWDVPAYPLEIPSSGQPMPPRWWETSKHGWETMYPQHQLDAVEGAYHDLIRFIEELTGRSFSHDRLRHVMDLANRQQTYFADIRDAMIAHRSVVSLSEQLGNVMAIQWRRGSEWATETARIFRDEVLERVASQQWISEREDYRLMWMGAGLWQNTGFYRAFEEEYGAVFVRSMYMSIAIDGYPRYGSDALRALASRYCGIGLGSLEWEVHEARIHQVDGVVTVAGTVNRRVRTALAKAGIPMLVLDVDLVDGRTWDEERINAQMRAFITEELAPRKAARA